MTYASISIDRREAYYERAAKLIAADPLGFYCRAEAGRRVQSRIKPKDLQKVQAGLNVSQLIRQMIDYEAKHNPPKIVYQDHSTTILQHEVRQQELLMLAQLDCEATIFPQVRP